MITSMRYSKSVALVTGSTQGLGKEIARAYLREGARVAIHGRNIDRVLAVQSELEMEAPGRVLSTAAEISSPADCERMIDRVLTSWGALEILVNNAGTSIIANSEDVSPSDWLNTLNVNLSGSFYASQIAARAHMIEHGGSIVMMSSILGRLGLERRAAYCASKHGLIGLTRALSVEWARHGIRVNALCPSYISTPEEIEGAETGAWGYFKADIEGRTPLGRYGTPREVANACLWLTSEESSFTTGSILGIDGGWTAYGGW